MTRAERNLPRFLQLPLYLQVKREFLFEVGNSTQIPKRNHESHETTRNKKPLADFMAFPKQCEKHGMKSHAFREISCVS